MKKGLLDTIKSRGYWRINFEPLVDAKKFKRLAECREAVEKASISFRGWDYPHIPRRMDDDDNVAAGDNYYEGWTNWWNHIEFWRMYQSGQFLNYFAVHEDWLTEVFQFLSRLTAAGVYDEGVRVSISLHNTEGRKLWTGDFMRHLFQEYKTQLDTIEFSNTFTREEILTKPKECAFQAVIYIFERFGWDNPPHGTINQDQENLINRRF